MKISLFKVFTATDITDKVGKVLTSGFLGQGSVNADFEEALRKKLGHVYLNTTNSATSAEHLAFNMLKRPFVKTGWEGLNNGSEVLATPLSCLATSTAPLNEGLRLKWVDIDLNTLNFDLDDLERKITKTTRVINPVHWSGIPVNLDRLKEIQQKTKELLGFKPAIVEDAAHALGAKYKGKYIGTHGNLVTFSFQAIKTPLTTGDGGMLSCPNQDLYRLSRLLRWYGIDRDDPSKTQLRCDGDVEIAGFKYHMNDINSAIGLANLPYFDDILNKHRENAKFYDDNLKNITGLRLLKRDPDSEPSFWIYSMLVEDRINFIKVMTEKGIHVNQVHMRIDQHSCMKEFKAHLPNLDFVNTRLINIPVHWDVSTEDRQYIIDCIKQGW